MTPRLDRRTFIRASAALAAGGLLSTRLSDARAVPVVAQVPSGQAPPKPAALDPQAVMATVSVAHRSLEEVRKLVEPTPLLANACWDWGGGDFETPLQAAAHMGNRDIALYLLSKGARQDVFAAAMLGQLEFVKAAHAVDPRAHEIHGPHGFTLLHCAKAGGERAQPVVDWLLANGASEETFRELPYALTPEVSPA